MKCSIIGWTITLLVSFTMIMPYLFGNYLLIESSTDMKAHTDVIESIIDNKPLPQILYNGQLITGYPLAFISKAFNIPVHSVYLMFNYAVLALVPIVIYIVSRIILSKRYIMVAPIVLLCSTSILALFKYGIIYNVINMYLILPIAIMASIKWINTKRIAWLISSTLLLSLFSYFHPTGTYLFYVLLVLSVILVYWYIKYRYVNTKPAIILLAVMIPLSWILSHNIPIMGNGVVENQINMPTVNNLMNHSTYNPIQYIIHVVGIPIYVMLHIVALRWVFYKEKISFNSNGKILMCILVSFAIVLLVGMYVTSGDVSIRLAIDSSGIIAIITSILISKSMFKMQKHFRYANYLVVFGLSIPTFLSLLNK